MSSTLVRTAAAALPVLVPTRSVSGFRVLQIVVHRLGTRRELRRRSGPRHLQRARGTNRRPLGLGRRCRRSCPSARSSRPRIFLIDPSSTDCGVEFTTGGRITASMKHSWHTDVLRICERGSEFVRQVESRNRVCRPPYASRGFFGFTSGATLRSHCSPLAGTFVPNGLPPTSAAYDTLFAELPVTLTTPSVTARLIHRCPELQGCARQQFLPRCRRRLAHLRSCALERAACGRASLIDAPRRVADFHPDFQNGDVEAPRRRSARARCLFRCRDRLCS